MTHPHMITDADAALEFAFGGNARFTLVSRKTGDRKTFRVRKAQDNDGMYFAQLLTGPDNTADYTYLGFIKAPRKALIAGKKGNPSHPAFIALDWALANLDAGKMPEQLEFWHEGRCSRCARVLTDPASIERGVGPECAKKED
jgi:hypothetical protein